MSHLDLSLCVCVCVFVCAWEREREGGHVVPPFRSMQLRYSDEAAAHVTPGWRLVLQSPFMVAPVLPTMSSLIVIKIKTCIN